MLRIKASFQISVLKIIQSCRESSIVSNFPLAFCFVSKFEICISGLGSYDINDIIDISLVNDPCYEGSASATSNDITTRLTGVAETVTKLTLASFYVKPKKKNQSLPKANVDIAYVANLYNI